MTIDENGVAKWVDRRNLYRDDLLYKLKACVKAWAILGIVLFLFLLVIFLIDEKFSFSLKLFTVPSIVGGGGFVAFTLLTLPCLLFLAWANGGVEEWEYEAKKWHVKGRKIVHHPGRMKVLRFFVGLAMIMSTKPNQTMAMRRLLSDCEKKEFDIWLFNDLKITGNEETHTIKLKSKGNKAEIHVSREDYAQMLTFFAPETKSKPKRPRKKKSKVQSEQQGESAESPENA